VAVALVVTGVVMVVVVVVVVVTVVVSSFIVNKEMNTSVMKNYMSQRSVYLAEELCQNSQHNCSIHNVE
jgi:hypothetical protein